MDNSFALVLLSVDPKAQIDFFSTLIVMLFDWPVQFKHVIAFRAVNSCEQDHKLLL